MFDSAKFIEECRLALAESDARSAVRELVARAVSEPSAVIRALGAPTRAGVTTLYRSGELTILNLAWGPQMVFPPHDHRMWAVIGIYGGREDNTFYRRDASGLTRHGMRQLTVRDTIPLGETVIHAVTNPLQQVTAAIHVYGGDFFATARSEWDPRTFEERPYDLEKNMRRFEEANERLRAGGTC
jgi:predicted metal-dependent enzyme (double-stranded beta helix superfamily)